MSQKINRTGSCSSILSLISPLNVKCVLFFRPHPHNLVGKEGCKKGVCTLEINPETMRAVFSNLGIQCVKKKDIEAALKAREEIRVDPFKSKMSWLKNLINVYS